MKNICRYFKKPKLLYTLFWIIFFSSLLKAGLIPEYQPPFPIEPNKAALYSAFVPGGGHFYLREKSLGYRFLISESALLAGAIANQITINQNNSPEMNVALLQFDKLHELGIFFAYRNARLKRNNRGYTYPVDETKLKDLILAPFYWKNISSPEVYSFALFSGILVALTYNYQNKPRSINDLESIRMFGSQFDKTSGALLYETTWAGLSLGAGVGEETFFRGFWQAELDEHFGKKWGLPIAAFTFGILHFYGKDTAERMTNVVLATAGGYYLG